MLHLATNADLRAAHPAPPERGVRARRHLAVAALPGAQHRLKQLLHGVRGGARAPLAPAVEAVVSPQPLPPAPRIAKEKENEAGAVAGGWALWGGGRAEQERPFVANAPGTPTL